MSSDEAAVQEPLLQLRGLSKEFPGAVALRDISFTVRAGEFIAVVGPSGSGKSTLLNILGLLDTHSAGSYLVKGYEVDALRDAELTELRASTFGFVFQESHMVGRDSAARNAILGLRARGVGPNVQSLLVGPALARFGLAHRVGTRAASLSGGERQRLAIARAIVGKPEIILADEPTGSLDSANGRLVLEHLRSLHGEGATVIIVTHDLDIAKSADRVITMRDGGIVSDVTEKSPVSSADLPVNAQLEAGRERDPNLVRKLRHEMVDLAADAVSALTVRPVKALLLILAFLLGSGGLVASIGLSESAVVKVSSRLDVAGSDEVRATRDGGYSAWADVRRDANKVRGLAGVYGVGIVADLSATEVQPSTLRPDSYPDQPAFTGNVRIADSEFLRIQGVQVAGGDPNLLDNSFGGPIAILGRDAAKQLGIRAAGPGSTVWLFGQPVPVVGLITESGRDPVFDSSVVVGIGSYPVANKVAAQLVVRTADGMPAGIAEALPKAISPEQTGAVKVEAVADLRELKQGINGDLGRLVALVSGILLVIACLSAGTTMYLGVLARSSEIALRRALGMRRTAIAGMFLVEGAIVGLLGGAAGASIGIAAVLSYAASEGWAPVVPWSAPIWGIAIGLGSGIAAAVYPATIATRAKPAQLIRS